MKEKQKTTVLPWVLSTLRLNRNGARGGGGRHFFGCAWQLQTADVVKPYLVLPGQYTVKLLQFIYF